MGKLYSAVPLFFFIVAVNFPDGKTVLAQNEAETATVVVTGESPIYEANSAQAKERALQEAFVAAISKVMGTFVTAESFTQNFVSIDRSVLNKTKGYIKTYEILELQEQPDYLVLKVQVVVSKQSVADDLTALGILLDAMGNPMAVILGEDEGLPAPESVAVFRQFLSQKGFYLIEDSLGKQPDLSVQLAGKIQNQNKVEGTGFSGAIVSLTATVFDPKTNNVVVSEQTMANGAGLNEAAALKEAYQKAGRDLARKMVQTLSEKWGRQVTSGRPIEVTANLEDYASLQNFTRRLQNVFGVKKVDLKSFQNNRADYLVRFPGQTGTLVDLVMKAMSDKMAVSVIKFDASSIEFTVH
jgi:hypothetical protein